MCFGCRRFGLCRYHQLKKLHENHQKKLEEILTCLREQRDIPGMPYPISLGDFLKDGTEMLGKIFKLMKDADRGEFYPALVSN